jgi:hypothetical protein
MIRINKSYQSYVFSGNSGLLQPIFFKYSDSFAGWDQSRAAGAINPFTKPAGH